MTAELTKRQETAQSTYDQRKKEGKCPHCGGERNDPKTVYCSQCQALAANVTRSRGDRYQAEGLCRRCGLEDSRSGRLLGPDCAEKARVAREKLRRSKGIQPRGSSVRKTKVVKPLTRAQMDRKNERQRNNRRAKSKTYNEPRKVRPDDGRLKENRKGASPKYQATWNSWIARMRTERAALSDHEAEQDTLLELSQ